MPTQPDRRVHALVALWALCCSGGLAGLAAHSVIPAREPGSHASPQWPVAAEVSPGPHDTLVLFAHPKCPCTRATLAELERVAASAPGAAIEVLFYRPSALRGADARPAPAYR